MAAGNMQTGADGASRNGHAGVRRELGVFTATAIVVANMIGVGIFTTSGILSDKLPDFEWVISCWIFGGLLAIAGALCYAELATRMPEEGAEYTYLKRLYHPALGFLTGWTSFVVGFSAPIAAAAVGFAEYLFAGLESRLAAVDPSQIIAAKKVTALSVILIFTALHYTGLRTGGKIQNVLTVVKVAIILGLASAGLAFGKGDWAYLVHSDSQSSGGMAIGTAMMLVMFSYSGWNASAYIAGEVRSPRRTLPVSLVAGTVIVIVLYLAINLFIFHALPYRELKGTIAVVERAAVSALGGWMGKGISIMVALALLSSLSAYVLIGPRVCFAMARDRLFFPFAAAVHPRFGVPGRSIIVQGAVACVMVLVGSFEQLLVYIGFALSIFPWLAVAGVFIARRRGIGDSSAVKAWGYPLVPVFFLASGLALMVVAYANRPLESTAAVLTILTGIPCYLLWVRGLRIRRGACTEDVRK